MKRLGEPLLLLILLIQAATAATIGISPDAIEPGGTITVTVGGLPRIEDPADPTIYDDAQMRVEAGSVTITISGTGTYYIGEEITLSGTCTESEKVYFFMIGPNLSTDGANLTQLRAVNPADASTFESTTVCADDTWSFKWNTADVVDNGRYFDAGGYTIYAVSAPVNKKGLSGAKYATASINLRSGFVTATTSGATVAKGDRLTISGIARGSSGKVYIWIFGKNFYGNGNQLYARPINVEFDGSFEENLNPSDTKDLIAGQYFVVVQHPMGNKPGVFVDTEFRGPGTGYINGSGIIPVDLTTLQASAATNALISALDSPNIPDTYAKLTFVVAEPNIFIDPIGTRTTGSKFTISGTTNLAVGDTLNVEVTSAGFQPGQKTDPSNISSIAGTVVVQKGDGMNKWSFEVDATGFKPDQYIVRVESIDTGTTETTTFSMLEGPETPPAPDNLTLFPGWNFISIPRPLAAENNTAAIFAGVETGGRSILRYDTAAGDWTALDEQDRLAPLEGFWIYSAGPTAVPLNFSTDPLLPPAERTLVAGWNAIGTTGNTPATARDTLYSVNAQWTALIGFDARNQAFETGIVNGGSGANTDTRSVYPGRGYWLSMTGPGTLYAIGA